MIYVFVIVVLALLVGIYFLYETKSVHHSPKRTSTIDRAFVNNKWSEIEQTFNIGGPSNFKASIMEADKLVDHVLKSKGVHGETFGERLKNAKPKFSNYKDYNDLWFAHKVRNNIVHEATHDLGSAEAKMAIDYYKKALKELGVL